MVNKIKLTDNIIELNRDMEPCVIQGSVSRPKPFHDQYVPLQFVHFSDIHNKIKNFNRVVEYVNYYKDYIEFALHTGDYCEASQIEYTDLYNEGDECVRPIFNCTGNHDKVANNDWRYNIPCDATKQSAYELLFNRTENWDVIFMPGEYSMTYYKDFPKSHVRIIVLDNCYDLEAQAEWLKTVLEDAREKALHVITSSHFQTAYISAPLDTPFHTINDYKLLRGEETESVFEQVIVDFKNNGGIHVCHLAGHNHHDRFGYTQKGVLNSTVECATCWFGWTDGIRVEGTRTFDCFNIVSVDVNVGVFTFARIGNNVDHYLRRKHTLCFDYINDKLI